MAVILDKSHENILKTAAIRVCVIKMIPSIIFNQHAHLSLIFVRLCLPEASFRGNVRILFLAYIWRSSLPVELDHLD